MYMHDEQFIKYLCIKKNQDNIFNAFFVISLYSNIILFFTISDLVIQHVIRRGTSFWTSDKKNTKGNDQHGKKDFLR